MSSSGQVWPGADVAAATGWEDLRGRRVGVVSNPTGVLRDTRHIVDDLAATPGIELVGLFGPEHGFRGTAQAGASERESRDPRTGVPVYDAYRADEDGFAELYRRSGADTVVFDIQDVGARFYTYIWTLYRAMAGALVGGQRFVVLDRPNPVGGRPDGALASPGFRSGVGLREIAQQHGMTIGELADFFNGEFFGPERGARADLHVVGVRGWHPDLFAQDLDLAWVPPSPNIPAPSTATVYPGTGLFEGTNLSEGRGTTRPFELIGAPFLDHHWAERLARRALPGVAFREASFVPTFDLYQGEPCAGVQLHVTDPATFEPIRAAVAMLVEARRYPEFAWREDDWDTARPYWIDKLSGSPRLRELIDAGADVDDVVASWQPELAEFRRRRQPYLRYGVPAGDAREGEAR